MKMRAALRRLGASAAVWLRGTTQGALLQWREGVKAVKEEEEKAERERVSRIGDFLWLFLSSLIL